MGDKASDLEEEKLPLLQGFTVLSVVETGIDFRNDLKETVNMNGLFFEYFYNGGGVAVGDLNGDELPDIYFISNLKSNKLYLNQGKLKFKDITELSGVKGKYGFPTRVSFVDINAEGRLDIYICKSGAFDNPEHRRNELYINLGNNNDVPQFKEVAAMYGLDLPYHSTQSSFFDYDKDGDLDMFLINHGVVSYTEDLIESYQKEESKLWGERFHRHVDMCLHHRIHVQSFTIEQRYIRR